VSQIDNICKKYNKEPEEVVLLKDMLKGHMGYFVKMSEWVYRNGTKLEEIKDILDLLQVVKINRPINSFDSSEQLYDYICETQNKRKLNQIVKSIPSRSRKNVSERIKKLIYNNIESETLFKDFLSKKGGTCKTEDDLYQRILEIINLSGGDSSYKGILWKIKRKLFFLRIKSILWSILLLIPRLILLLVERIFEESFKWIYDWKKLISTSNPGKIVYKDGKTIIVKINTFSASFLLGSRHWCISRTPSYWDNYIDNENVQYFIYQTEYNSSDKESMVGATIRPYNNIVKASHFRNDNSCPSEYVKKYSKYLKGENKKITSLDQIYRYGICDINTIMKIKGWEEIFRSNWDESGTYVETGAHHWDRFYRKPNIMMEISYDILNNKDKYSHHDICKYIRKSIDNYNYSNRNSINLSSVFLSELVKYGDPFFEDENSKNLLTMLKVAKVYLRIDFRDYWKRSQYRWIYEEYFSNENGVCDIINENISYCPNWESLSKYQRVQMVSKFKHTIKNK
tara:strand:- start:36659 stop:38194 length:1536 start_codon:yes stop_codon:yes gene_type:complete